MEAIGNSVMQEKKIQTTKRKSASKIVVVAKSEPWPEITVRKSERLTPRTTVQFALALLFSLLVLVFAAVALYRNDESLINKAWDLTSMIGAGLMGWALGRAPGRPKNE
jgi:heme/copper-type cytochrome/quinol oxidase subunit 3